MKGTTATAPYVSLPMGEEYIFVADDNPLNIPIDLSKESLRDYSPFVLSVKPPPLKYGRISAPRPFTSPLSPISSSLGRKAAPVGRVSSNASRPIGGAGDVRPAFSTRDQLIDIATQMSHMDSLPPIVFLINPSNMGVAFSDIQAFSEMSRTGFIFQRWGEDLPKLSFTFNIGAFITGRADGAIGGLSGLHFASRRDSAAWRHLMSIFAVYRNSGAIVDRLGGTRANHAVGTQSIHYDGQEWEGRITSFSYGIDEQKQLGGIEVSFDFTVYKHVYKDFDFKSEVLPLNPPSASPTPRRTTGVV